MFFRQCIALQTTFMTLLTPLLWSDTTTTMLVFKKWHNWQHLQFSFQPLPDMVWVFYWCQWKFKIQILHGNSVYVLNDGRKVQVLPFACFHAAERKVEGTPDMPSSGCRAALGHFCICSNVIREKEKTDSECLQLWSEFLDRCLSGPCRKMGPLFAFDLSSPARKNGRS